jgi:hypothetical protein
MALELVCGPQYTGQAVLYLRSEITFEHLQEAERKAMECFLVLADTCQLRIAGRTTVSDFKDKISNCIIQARHGSTKFFIKGHRLATSAIYAWFAAGLLGALQITEAEFRTVEMEESRGRKPKEPRLRQFIATDSPFPFQFTCSLCKKKRLSAEALPPSSGGDLPTCDRFALFENCEDPELLFAMFSYWQGTIQERGWWRSKGFLTAHGEQAGNRYLADLPLLFCLACVLVPEENVFAFDPMNVVEELGFGNRVAERVWVKNIGAANAHFLRKLWRRIFMARPENGTSLWEVLVQNVDFFTFGRQKGLEVLTGICTEFSDQELRMAALRSSWTRIIEREIVERSQRLRLSPSHDAMSQIRSLRFTLSRALDLLPPEAPVRDNLMHLEQLLSNGVKPITEMPKMAFVGDSSVGKTLIIDALARSMCAADYTRSNRDDTELKRDAQAIAQAERLSGADMDVEALIVIVNPSKAEQSMVSRNVCYALGYGKGDIDRKEKEQEELWRRYHEGNVQALKLRPWVEAMGNASAATTQCNTYWRYSSFFAVTLCYASAEQLIYQFRADWARARQNRDSDDEIDRLFLNVRRIRNEDDEADVTMTQKRMYLASMFEVPRDDVIPKEVSKWLGRCYVIRTTNGSLVEDRLFIRRVNHHAQGLAEPFADMEGNVPMSDENQGENVDEMFPLTFVDEGRAFGKQLLPALRRRIIYVPSLIVPRFGVLVDSVGFNDSNASPDDYEEVLKDCHSLVIVTKKKELSKSTKDKLREISEEQKRALHVAVVWNVETSDGNAIGPDVDVCKHTTEKWSKTWSFAEVYGFDPANCDAFVLLAIRGISWIMDKSRLFNAKDDYAHITHLLGIIESFNLRSLLSYLTEVQTAAQDILSSVDQLSDVSVSKVKTGGNRAQLRQSLQRLLEDEKTNDGISFKDALWSKVERTCCDVKTELGDVELTDLQRALKNYSATFDDGGKLLISTRDPICKEFAKQAAKFSGRVAQEVLKVVQSWLEELFVAVKHLMLVHFGVDARSATERLELYFRNNLKKKLSLDFTACAWGSSLQHLSSSEFREMCDCSARDFEGLLCRHLLWPMAREAVQGGVLPALWDTVRQTRKERFPVVLLTKLMNLLTDDANILSVCAPNVRAIVRSSVDPIGASVSVMRAASLQELESEENALSKLLRKTREVLRMLQDTGLSPKSESFVEDATDDILTLEMQMEQDFSGVKDIVKRGEALKQVIERKLLEARESSARSLQGRRLVAWLRLQGHKMEEIKFQLTTVASFHVASSITLDETKWKQFSVVQFRRSGDVSTLSLRKAKTPEDLVRWFVELTGLRFQRSSRDKVLDKVFVALANLCDRLGNESLGAKFRGRDFRATEDYDSFELLKLLCDISGVSLAVSVPADEKMYSLRPREFRWMPGVRENVLAYHIVLYGFEQSRSAAAKFFPILGSTGPIQPASVTSSVDVDLCLENRQAQSVFVIKQARVIFGAKDELQISFSTFEEFRQILYVEIVRRAPCVSCVVLRLPDGSELSPERICDGLSIVVKAILCFGRLGAYKVTEGGSIVLKTRLSGDVFANEVLSGPIMVERGKLFSHFWERYEYLQGAPWKKRWTMQQANKLLRSSGEDALCSSPSFLAVFDGVSGRDRAEFTEFSKQYFVERLSECVHDVDLIELPHSAQRRPDFNCARYLLACALDHMRRTPMQNYSRAVTTTATVLFLLNHELHWYVLGDSLFAIVRYLNGRWVARPVGHDSTFVCLNCRQVVKGKRANCCSKSQMAPLQLNIQTRLDFPDFTGGVVAGLQDGDLVIAGSDGFWDAIGCPHNTTEQSIETLCRVLNGTSHRSAHEIGSYLASYRIRRLRERFGIRWETGTAFGNENDPKPDDCSFVVASVSRGSLDDGSASKWHVEDCNDASARYTRHQLLK